MERSTTKGRLRAAATGVTAGFALMGAGEALAATANGAGGVLTYTGGAGLITNVFADQEGTTVTLFRQASDRGADNDPIVVSGTCTLQGGGGRATCTDITSVVADTGDQDDRFDASELTIPTTLRGGAGNDSLFGGSANDTVSGGDDSDFLSGGAGDDTVNGEGGNDFELDGDAGTDTVNGGAGNDGFLSGGAGNDVVNGDAGDDFGLDGGPGTDVVNGGDGDDFITDNSNSQAGVAPEADGGDVYNGGSGLDAIRYNATNFDASSNVSGATTVSVTFDEAANDGIAGEGDNVRADVEGVFTDDGNDTLTGNDATNQLTGSGGNDTIDGGRGNDVLQGNDGDDTLNARDGFADFVTCGAGADVANVDSLDTVSSDCETVNRVDVGNANEDRPPALTLVGPGDNATVATTGPTTYTATVTDDRGIAQVLFLANGRIVCTDTAAPYTCAYQPTGGDIGRTAITAIAVDSSQQTATATKTIIVGLFKSTAFTSKVTPGRDTKRPYRFVVTGKLTLPGTVTPAQGCRAGIVSVQVKAGSRTISTRRATLTSTCTYRSTVVLRDRSRFRGATALKFTARFQGTTVVERRTASVKTARVK